MNTLRKSVRKCCWLLLIWMGACAEQSGVQVLTLAHTLPVTHPVHKGIEDFRDSVALYSGGQLEVRIYPDGQLGSEREVVEMLQIGSIDITKVSAAVMTNFSPAYAVLGLPYLFRSDEHRFAVLEGRVGEELLEGGVEFWLRGLAFYDAGNRSFYTRERKISSPEDLKGLKIRVMDDPLSVQTVNALGAAATPMPFGELYTALQQGVVDGAENNPPSLLTSRHFEVCRYYTLDRHSAVPDVLVIGTKAWDRLSPQARGWLRKAAAASSHNQKGYWSASVAECMDRLREAGVEIIEPDQSPFFEATEGIRRQASQDSSLRRLITLIQQQP